jgi:hypothetical protein
MTRHYPKLFIAIFLGILLLPLRTLALDPYAIEDSFYPRARLVTWTSNLRLLIGDRVYPKVLVGDNGWLVYTAEGDLDLYEKNTLFTEEQLAQFQINLDALSTNYAERGITLVVVIAPSKNTIYPERVPAQIPQFGGESKLDQVVEYLSAHGETRILDLRPALLQAKTERGNLSRHRHALERLRRVSNIFPAYGEGERNPSKSFPPARCQILRSKCWSRNPST